MTGTAERLSPAGTNSADRVSNNNSPTSHPENNPVKAAREYEEKRIKERETMQAGRNRTLQNLAEITNMVINNDGRDKAKISAYFKKLKQELAAAKSDAERNAVFKNYKAKVGLTPAEAAVAETVSKHEAALRAELSSNTPLPAANETTTKEGIANDIKELKKQKILPAETDDADKDVALAVNEIENVKQELTRQEGAEQKLGIFNKIVGSLKKRWALIVVSVRFGWNLKKKIDYLKRRGFTDNEIRLLGYEPEEIATITEKKEDLTTEQESAPETVATKTEIEAEVTPGLTADINPREIQGAEGRELINKAITTEIKTLAEEEDKPKNEGSASSRVDHANRELMQEMIGFDTVFDPANLIELGSTSVTETGKKIVSGELSLDEEDGPLDRLTPEQRVKAKYLEYFTKPEEQKLINSGEIPSSGYMRRVLIEMNTTIAMIEERNKRVQALAEIYIDALGATGANLEEKKRNSIPLLEGEGAAERMRVAEVSVKRELILQALDQRYERQELAPDLIDDLLENSNLILTAAGPAIILPPDRMQIMVNLLAEKGEKITEGKDVIINGFLTKDIIFITDEKHYPHELSHQVNRALRQARAAAAEKIIARLIVDNLIKPKERELETLQKTDPRYKELQTEIENLNQTQIQTIMLQQATAFLHNERLDQEQLLKFIQNEKTEDQQEMLRLAGLMQQHLQDEEGRAEVLKRVYENTAAMPLMEELGSYLQDHPLTERISLSLIGLNPESFTANPDKPLDEKVIATAAMVDMLNRIADRLNGLPEEEFKKYAADYDYVKSTLAREIQERGDMTIGEMYRFMNRLTEFNKLALIFKDGDNRIFADNITSRKGVDKDGKTEYTEYFVDGVWKRDYANAPYEPEPLAILRKYRNEKMSALDFNIQMLAQFGGAKALLQGKPELQNPDFTSQDKLRDLYNKYLNNELNTPELKRELYYLLVEANRSTIGLASEHITDPLMTFSTGLTGGSYSSTARTFLTSGMHKQRHNLGKGGTNRKAVDMIYAFKGNKAAIMEDTRGSALFILRGLWNPLDILGVTPYKMNEAYGAWVVRLLGKKAAGFFGFHDALGANPIEKGIPGGLGRLPIFKELSAKLKIPAIEDPIMNRIKSPKIIDTVAQHSASIGQELGKFGLSQSEILLIMEAIGGFKMESTGYSNSRNSFHDIDEHRYNHSLAQMEHLSPELKAFLTKDTINGLDIDELVEQKFSPFLRKGQMSDNLLKLITSMTTANRMQDYVDAHKKENPGVKGTDVIELFYKMGKAMMQEDLEACKQTDAAGAISYDGEKHFTIKELIDRVNMVENSTGPGGSVNLKGKDAAGNTIDLGKGDWPEMKVRIGDEFYDVDDVKMFVDQFYKAKSKIVMEIGVFGQAKGKQLDITNLLPNEQVLLEKNHFVIIRDPRDKTRFVRVTSEKYADTSDPRGYKEVFYEAVYDPNAQIQKLSPQGLPIKYDAIPAFSDTDITYLFGEAKTDGDYEFLEDGGGKVVDSIDDDIEAKKSALDYYFQFTQRYLQTMEFAEVAKLKKKLWGFFANMNRIIRWTSMASIVIGLTVWPPALGIIFARPDIALSIFAWDWTMSRFLNRSRDGWGARNGIAEEVIGKLDGMRSMFEQARAAQSISTDNQMMLRSYLGAIEKMWEDLMPSYDKVVKYKPNITQRISNDFWNLSKQFVQLP